MVHLHLHGVFHKEFMMTTCFNPLCSEWYLFCLAFILGLHDISKFLYQCILYLIFGAYTSVVLRLCCLCLISLACKRSSALIIFITAPILTYTINPYPTAFPYGNGMVLHFYQQQERSTTKTVHKVINKGLKTYV